MEIDTKWVALQMVSEVGSSLSNGVKMVFFCVMNITDVLQVSLS